MALMKICKYCNKKYEYDKDCSCKGKENAKKSRQKYYDKNVRNSKENKKYNEFYHSKEWKRIRELVMTKYNGLCLYSLLIDKKVVKADVIHHLKEIRSSWDDRLNMDNLIPLCHSKHNLVHNTYDARQMSILWDLLEQYKREYM